MTPCRVRSEIEGRHRRGAVLVIAVLLLLAVVAVAHGVLLLARFELAASLGGARQLAGRAAAEGAVTRLIETPIVEEDAATPLGSRYEALSGRVGDVEYTGRLVRLSREQWLIEGEGRARAGPLVRAHRSMWVLAPVTRVAESLAVVVVGPLGSVAVSGTVDGGRMTLPDAWPAGVSCNPWRASLDSVVPTGRLPPWVAVDDSADVPRLGRLGFDSLMNRMPRVSLESGSPEPVERGGRCLAADPWNWGDPDRPNRPCGAYHFVGATAANALVRGGVGQGLLVVDGDLVLTDGVRFYGVVLVRGHLSVSAGAMLKGLAQARDGIVVDVDSRVDGSGCRAAESLQAAWPYLGHGLPTSGWLTAY